MQATQGPFLDVKYRPGKNARGQDGRRFVCGSLGTQSLSSVTRDFLHQSAHGDATECGRLSDLDFVNCFPTILLSLLQAAGIPCQALHDYVGWRFDHLALVSQQQVERYGVHWAVPEKSAKMAFIFILHGGGDYRKLSGLHAGGIPVLTQFQEEVRSASRHLSQRPEIQALAALCEDADNPLGTFIAALCQRIEHAALSIVISECALCHVTMHTNMFDGGLVSGFASLAKDAQAALISRCEDRIKAELHIPLRLLEKPISDVSAEQLHQASRKLVLNDEFETFTPAFSQSAVHAISRRYVGYSLLCDDQVVTSHAERPARW